MPHPKVLVCYSNPIDTSRLRLDIEHNLLEEALVKLGVNPVALHRIHATRMEDLISELATGQYEILQFSGHGDEAGIYLENRDRNAAELLDKDCLKEILSLSPDSLRAVILTCCYSGAYRDELAQYVPYLISVTGPVADAAAIQFSKVFFALYIGKQASFESAVKWASITARQAGNIEINISRRGLLAKEGFVVQATVETGSILLNLTPISGFIDRLPDRQRDRFLDAVCTSIRAHFHLFKSAMCRVAIPFGEYVGVFTWQNEVDHVTCEQVFAVADSVTGEQFEIVARLLTEYTALARQRHRSPNEKEPVMPRSIEFALDLFHRTATTYFSGPYGGFLQTLAPGPYKISSGMIRANLAQADASVAREQYSEATVFFEIALTSLHNFMLELLRAISAEVTHA